MEKSESSYAKAQAPWADIWTGEKRGSKERLDSLPYLCSQSRAYAAKARKSFPVVKRGKKVKWGKRHFGSRRKRASGGITVMENLPVYHGPIGKDEGERRLGQDGRDGCYLVRNSDTVEGVYCLCVLWVQSKKKVQHLLLFYFSRLRPHNHINTYKILFCAVIEIIDPLRCREKCKRKGNTATGWVISNCGLLISIK